jgi:hypothetical protein
MDQESDGAAMARMLDLTDVFELIVDGLDDGPLAQQELIREGEQPIVHFFAQLGDEAKSLGDQELLRQRLREITLITIEAPKEPAGEFRNRAPIIDIAGSQTEGQQVALGISDQVQLEAIEPADRSLPACSTSLKDAVLMDAGVVADLCWLLGISVLK